MGRSSGRMGGKFGDARLRATEVLPGGGGEEEGGKGR